MYRIAARRHIEKLRAEGLYRVFHPHRRPVNGFPRIRSGGGSEICWCSNDYLNMSHHPKVIRAGVVALEREGVGAGGTRNISGNLTSVVELESRIAAFHRKERGLVFNSGFSANVGALRALGTLLPDAMLLSDADNHASMIDGIRQSGLEKKIWRHNDVAHLTELLEAQPLDRPKVIVMESLYSMDGSTAPLREITKLARRYDAMTYVDEIHAVGLYGKGGRGRGELEGCINDIDILQGGFGKGFGTQGGYIVGDDEIVDAIRTVAKSFIFTTSNSNVITEATMTSVDLVEHEMDEARVQMFERVNETKTRLTAMGFTVMCDEPTHIVPVFVGDAFECKRITQALLERGHYIQPIQYPTVPRDSARLRITPTYKHTSEMIESLCADLDEITGPQVAYRRQIHGSRNRTPRV